MKIRYVSLGLITGWAICAGAAQAATLTTTGTWSDTVGGFALSGEGTNQIAWGVPAEPEFNPTGEQSSYGFDGVATTVDLSDLTDAPFLLGTFTHNNLTITADGGSLISALLNVDLQIDDFSQLFSFDFAHDETANVPESGICAAGGEMPCPDVVSFPNAVSDQFITLDGVGYNLELIGFSTDDTAGGSVDAFLTLEQQANSAGLYARLTEVNNATTAESVPEPVTGLGLIAVGSVAATLKHRKG